MRSSILAAVIPVVLALPWNPVPPCAAPEGITNPAVNESMCSNQVATAPYGIIVREIGLPVNETLITASAGGSYLSAVPAAIGTIFSYFSGSNDEQRTITSATTVPFLIFPPGPYAPVPTEFTVSMMISTAQFPDSFLIPHPNPGAGSLKSVGNRFVVAFQFTTPGRLPYQAEFEEACGAILGSALPTGFIMNNVSQWSPTWVLYNAQAYTGNWTNECWMEVNQTST